MSFETTSINEKILTFFKATVRTEKNTSAVKMLPNDMIEKIIYEYYDGFHKSKNLEMRNMFYFDYKFNETGAVPFLFEEALHHSIQQRNSTLIEWYFSKKGHTIPRKSELDRAVDVACITGNLKLLVHLHTNFQVVGQKTFDLAVKKGQVDIMKWLHMSVGTAITINHLVDAIRYGNEDVLDFIRENDFSVLYLVPPFPLIDFACNYNHLHVVKWLDENHPFPGYSDLGMRHAIFHENDDLVDFLKKDYFLK